MSPSTLVRVQWMLAWLMPSAHAEALLGDLLEERGLRLHVGSPASVARWYWMQLASSLPVLLWGSLHRRSSLLTLVVAVASYLVAGGIAFVLAAALLPMTTSTFVQTVIRLLCGVTAMAAAGYVAALIRPGAALLIAVLVLVAASLMMANNPDSVPLWYEGSLLVLGSLAPIAGAALSGRWRKAC